MLSILMYKELIHKFHSWNDNLSSKSDNVLSPFWIKHLQKGYHSSLNSADI